jgi:sulfite reductase alpha subunit-like flavoprotein
LDIFGRPRRYFFHLLSFFALDELHAEKLREFATTEGQNDLYTYAHSMKRTTFEVLQDFTSVKVPLKYLLDLIPVIRPRSFSISSNFRLDQSKIQLLVAVVNFKTKMQKPRVGVCTDWMRTLNIGGNDVFFILDSIRFNISKGTMKLPTKSNVPIVCIATGK